MSTWQTYYHLVWATGDRTPLITDPIRPELYQYMQAKAKSLDCWFHAIGGIEDHVHLIVSIPPKLAIAQFVKRIKGSSSRHLNKTFPDQTFAWQREYGVFSLGRKQLPDAIAYVENQKHHHDTQTLIRGLEPQFFNIPRKPH
ncbi:IS200/IS605 family transposase [Vacuolonema iberomarrocanum]|uniref:IS200/IS605 family transposase n=1 Tax=Vacuolonema iberomarrocanum TaxID=3454632 RepID=UPI001A0EB4AA|nr:IS200/IS605 family transposase [filamentous cyanobacterium LEGE 07170]